MKLRGRLWKLLAVACTVLVFLTGCGNGNSGTKGTSGQSKAATEEKSTNGGASTSATDHSSNDATAGKEETVVSSGQIYEISLSTPHMSTTPMAQQAAWFAEEVSKQTNGQVKINLFFSNALGPQKDMFTQLTMGGVEMVMDGTMPVDYYAKEYGFLAAPFLITSEEHMLALIDSPIFEGFKEKLKENNIVIGGTCIRSSRNLVTSEKFQYEGLDSISKMVLRVPDNSLYVKAWETLGASCQILGGGEVYSSMQTGVINAVEGDWAQQLDMKMPEVGKYLYETNHVTEFGCIYINKDWIESLPEDLAQTVLKLADEAMKRSTEQEFQVNDSNKESLISQGMELIQVDRQAMIDKVTPVWKEMFENEWTAATYDEVMGYAK